MRMESSVIADSDRAGNIGTQSICGKQLKAPFLRVKD